MAERKTQGRVRLVKREQQDAPKEEVRDSRKEEPIATPDGYRFTEEVPSQASQDSLIAEDAPKARVEGQQVEPKITDLSPDSLTLANLCLGSTNAFVVMMFGQECGLYDGEKKLLYPSLARVINRMPAASAARASVFIDPIVLLLGLGIWTNRIVSIKSRQRAEANSITAREFAAASGIQWDRQRQQPAETGPVTANNEPPRQTGNGAGTVHPEVDTNTVNANGTIGKVPDAISNGRTDDINGV